MLDDRNVEEERGFNGDGDMSSVVGRRERAAPSILASLDIVEGTSLIVRGETESRGL